MLCQYHPGSTECYTFALENFFCRICTTASITEVNCTKYGYLGKLSCAKLSFKFSVGFQAQNFISSQCSFWFWLPAGCCRNSASSFWWTEGNINNNWTIFVCNCCFCSAVREENQDIVSIPMAGNIHISLEKFISCELLTVENEWFCPSCNFCKERIKDTSVIQFAPVLVIHLKHFCVEHDKVFQVPSWRPSSDQNHWQHQSFFFEQLLFGAHN